MLQGVGAHETLSTRHAITHLLKRSRSARHKLAAYDRAVQKHLSLFGAEQFRKLGACSYIDYHVVPKPLTCSNAISIVTHVRGGVAAIVLPHGRRQRVQYQRKT